MFYHQLTSGEITPFSIVQLEVIFNPLKSGNAVAEFEISFSDPLSPPVSRKHEDKLWSSLQKPCFKGLCYKDTTLCGQFCDKVITYKLVPLPIHKMFL